MQQIGWSVAFSTRGLLDTIITEIATETVFQRPMRQFAASIQFYKRCDVDGSALNQTPFGSGFNSTYTMFRLQDAVDILSGLWMQARVPALTPLPANSPTDALVARDGFTFASGAGNITIVTDTSSGMVVTFAADNTTVNSVVDADGNAIASTTQAYANIVPSARAALTAAVAARDAGYNHLHLVNAGAYAMLDQASLSVGGNQYVNMDSTLLYFLELATHGRNRLVHEVGDYRDADTLKAKSKGEQIFHAPLLFWFGMTKKDAIQVCNIGGQGILLRVTFDNFSNWLVNTYDDTWSNALITHTTQQLSRGAFDIIGRYHLIGDAERDYYMTSGHISVLFAWYRSRATRSKNDSATVNLQVNYPTRLVLVAVRHSSAMNGPAHAYKYGTKDKFCFRTPTGVNPIANLQMSIGGSNLLDQSIDSSFYQSQGMRDATSVDDDFGHGENLGMYAISTQSDVFTDKHIATINLSRFEAQQVQLDFKYIDPAADTYNEVFVYAYVTVPLVQENGLWSLPFGTHV